MSRSGRSHQFAEWRASCNDIRRRSKKKTTVTDQACPLSLISSQFISCAPKLWKHVLSCSAVRVILWGGFFWLRNLNRTENHWTLSGGLLLTSVISAFDTLSDDITTSVASRVLFRKSKHVREQSFAPWQHFLGIWGALAIGHCFGYQFLKMFGRTVTITGAQSYAVFSLNPAGPTATIARGWKKNVNYQQPKPQPTSAVRVWLCTVNLNLVLIQQDV